MSGSDAALLSNYFDHFIRPNCHTTYIDVICSCTLSTSVCQSVMIVSPARTAEPIEMLFWLWTWLGPRKHVLDGSARWHHLVNMIEPSMYGSKAALCHIFDHLLLLFGRFACTTYIHAACCFQPSSVVCRSVCHTSKPKPCRKSESIQMPFGLRTRMGLGNHVLDGGPDPPMGRGNFQGEKRRPIVEYMDTAVI